MPRPNLKEPPYLDNPQLYQYLLDLHQDVYGIGEDTTGQLDDDNLSADIPNLTVAETVSGVWTFSAHPLGLDHTQISNIGTNTHALIDTHIANTTIHFTVASIDHGLISGLLDDDHTQYQKETDFTAGSILFRGASAITEDNANLFWDDTNNRLGIGTATPSYNLDIRNTTGGVDLQLKSTAVGGGTGIRFDRGDINGYNNLFTVSTAGAANWVINQPGGTNDLRIYDYLGVAGERLRIKSVTGYIGIGTDAPATLLDVAGVITSDNYISDVADGTQPYASTFSTTLNTNLNADMLDGYHAIGLSALIDHGTVLGLLDDDHSQYIFNAPTSSTRNVIQPSTATVKALVLKGAASQSANLFEIQDSAGTAMLYWAAPGKLLMVRTATSTTSSDSLMAQDLYVIPTGASGVNYTSFVCRVFAKSDYNLTGTVRGASFDIKITTNSGGSTYTNLQGVSASIGDETGDVNTVTNAICFNASPVNASLSTFTNAINFMGKAHTDSGGTIINAYGMYLEKQTAGGTINNEVFLAGGGEIFFRDQAIHLGSLTDGHLDLTADISVDIHAPVLILPVKTDTGDPTGQEGAIYLNTFDNALRYYADGSWRTAASY